MKRTSALLLAAIASLAGCTTTPPPHSDLSADPRGDRGDRRDAFVNTTGRSNALTSAQVRKGIELVRAGNLTAATREFGSALRHDPQNSYLRFLHAFTHHLAAERSNPERYEEARIGYELALKFDPDNWLAAQQLARLSLSCRDFKAAQDNFARALLRRPADPSLLFGLAQASYYLGDIETALAAIRRASELQPQSPEIVAAHAVIAAAAGQPEVAQRSLLLFRGSPPRQAQLQERVDDWARFHAQFAAATDTESPAPVAAPTAAEPSPAQVAPPAPADPNPVPAPATTPPRMVVVDVVMIRTEENESSNKGINLMDDLSLTFSGKYTPPANRPAGANRWTWSDVVLATQPSMTELHYSLDIFNAGDDRTEVLAMPTLIALDGKPSTTFAGLTLNVAVKGMNAASISSLDAGVALEILPTFLSDRTLQMHVLARRTFVESGAVGSFDEAVRTSKNEVSADVVIELGQTLVLGGLREKQTTEMKSGVPLLRDIPVVQYLFSHEKTSDFHKSILFLLTPRKVSPGMYRSPSASDVAEPASSPAEREQLAEFRRRYGYLFEIEPNLARIMRHLDKHQLAKGMRSADFFDHPWWGSVDSINVLLDRAASFLLY